MQQNRQNPDVNSMVTEEQYAIREDIEPQNRGDNSDIERPSEEDIIRVPPGAQPTDSIEDPSAGDETPIGDVDDSPKKIAGE